MDFSETTIKDYHVHVDSKHDLFTLNLKETWTYRDLIWLMTRKNLVVRYKQTVLGPLWLILSPLMTSLMYTVFFGTVAGIDTEGLPKILFYLASNGLWAYFSTVFNRAADTFAANANMFGKVYFPRLTVPISNILLSCVEFLVQFLMLAGLCLWYCLHGMTIPFATWLLIPLILLWLGVMAMGLGILVSSFTTKYRDLRILVNFGIHLWMYGTPVVYPLSLLKGGILRQMVLWNPVTAAMELFRHWVLGTGSVLPAQIISSLLFTVVFVFIGISMFNRIERSFMDTI
ncbi:MAG: ABC transporter permease [Solobacterium sp.]|nr:ABC transporter permease [Solobacterium sp.]MBQ6531955.1 ABC transporter permease [Solobacterium sp.]MBR0213669.1 ABC transporter permease [Solobacterium sp.]MBR0397841.1 ABC transporter permease [Eubacterium sp.]